jgi:hypothetical protein
MGFHLYGFSSVWVFICMGFHLYGFSSVWVFICMGFHLWVFIYAEYASEALFDEAIIIRMFFCNAKLVYIII